MTFAFNFHAKRVGQQQTLGLIKTIVEKNIGEVASVNVAVSRK